MKISQDKGFRDKVEELNTAIESLKQYTEDWANAHTEEYTASGEYEEMPQNSFITGWTLIVGNSWLDEDGDLNDGILPYTSRELNRFTNEGLLRAGLRFFHGGD